MAEAPEGGRGRGFGRGGRGDGEGRGGRGRGRGRGRGGRGGRGKPEEKEWVPVTKLGRLVKEGKLAKLEQVYLFSLPLKEYQIIDSFIPTGKLKDEVMQICPVQKQTSAGQRTRFKAYVVVGDSDGHVGLGVKCSKEVATSIRSAIQVSNGGTMVVKSNRLPKFLDGKCVQKMVSFNVLKVASGASSLAGVRVGRHTILQTIVNVPTNACHPVFLREGRDAINLFSLKKFAFQMRMAENTAT